MPRGRSGSRSGSRSDSRSRSRSRSPKHRDKKREKSSKDKKSGRTHDKCRERESKLKARNDALKEEADARTRELAALQEKLTVTESERDEARAQAAEAQREGQEGAARGAALEAQVRTLRGEPEALSKSSLDELQALEDDLRRCVESVSAKRREKLEATMAMMRMKMKLREKLVGEMETSIECYREQQLYSCAACSTRWLHWQQPDSVFAKPMGKCQRCQGEVQRGVLGDIIASGISSPRGKSDSNTDTA